MADNCLQTDVNDDQEPQADSPATSDYRDVPGTDTGFIDNHLRPISVGDHMTVPRHRGECCEHFVTCEIRWNPEWNAYGMRAADGEWISGMGIASGFPVEHKVDDRGNPITDENA